MGRSGGVLGAVRRPLILWVVATLVWVIGMRVFSPDTNGFGYVFLPIYIGVALTADHFVPRRHHGWLPPLIAVLVTLPLALLSRAIS